MMWVATIVLLALASEGEAECYDKYADRYYATGSTFSRTKPMANSALWGTYNCDCSGNMMRCRATDIPCYDTTKQTFVAKDGRFNTIIGARRQRVNCICYGGRGAFGDCRDGWLKEGCRDLVTSESVSEGSTFNSKRFGTAVKCVCGKQGMAVRGSCVNTGCTDSTTSATVVPGSKYKINNLGITYECTCRKDGRPVRGSCERIALPAVNPCESGTSSCHASRAICRPHGSAYDCACTTGYQGDGRSCNDVDECSQENMCDENARCDNTEGSYMCSCNEGYEGDGMECAELDNVADLCDENAVFCSVSARCVSNATSFSCICFQGYTGDGTVCEDTDECATGAHTCDENATCKNTEGLYMCFCNAGYHGDGRRCTQMCRDERTQRFVRPHDVFVKVRNGRDVTCTCGKNAQELEGSCVGEEEPETTTTSAPTTPSMEAILVIVCSVYCSSPSYRMAAVFDLSRRCNKIDKDHEETLSLWPVECCKDRLT